MTIVALTIMNQFSNDLQTQWVQTNAPVGYSILCMISKNQKLFAGPSSLGVIVSTNNGNNWVDVNSGIPVPSSIYSFLGSDSNLFAGGQGSVYLTSNNGSNWISVGLGLPFRPVSSLVVCGSYIFASGFPNFGVWRTSDNGANWQQTVNGLVFHDVFCSAVSGSLLFAGTSTGGVRLTTSYGENWVDASNGLPANSSVISILATGNTIFASTLYNLYSSSNSGSNWLQVEGGLPLNYGVTRLVNSGTSIFAAVSSKGIFVTTNNGLNWNSVNTGFPITFDVQSFAIQGSYLFAGTQGNGIWRRPISEMISVQIITNEVPRAFSLEQNYPNPFNPTTRIRFSVPYGLDDIVKLVVYDILGREVSTLVNEELIPGIYEATFDLNDLSSGIYFYTLSAGKFRTTKKLIIEK
jgi:photosystem II stability/assembly factor-like uncharacterized protein